MKSIPTRFVPAAVAVTVAISACLAAATVVQAQTSPAPHAAPADARPPMPPGGHDMRGDHDRRGGPGMHMMREVERLKASLQLNAQQAALWDRAAATMKPQGDPRSEMKARHERMAAMIDDPNFDPRKLAAEMERQDTERRAKMQPVRDAWFAVYDSLNPAQRGQVREFLRERMTHGHHGMGGDRMEEMHRGGPKPPMAPPAPTH